jgi:hypothetical protein
MSEAFRLGGWGMYPTALAGIILVLWRGGSRGSPPARGSRS